MSSGDANNIYVMQKQLNDVISDITKKTLSILEKYKGDGIPRLPAMEEISKMKVYYANYDKYMEIASEIVDILVQLDMVTNQLDEILETKLGRDLSNNMVELRAFKGHIEKAVTRLKVYRYDLNDLKKIVNDKIRLLQGLLYRWNGGN